MRWESGFILWYIDRYLLISVPFVEKTVLSPLSGLGTYVKNQLIVNVRVYF